MFSGEVRYEIKERAGHKSELSGEMDRPLQCSHFFHDEKHPSYNEQEMGFLVTDIEHFMYHLRFRKNPKKIGLEKKENKSAIKTLWLGILNYNNCSLEEIYGRCYEAGERWDEFFETTDNFSDHPNSKETIPPLAKI